MAKNTLARLNDMLFEQLERINNEEADSLTLERELQKADGMAKLSKEIINNANVSLQAAKFCAEQGLEMSGKAEEVLPSLMG